jgi:hypothetical protein
MSAALEGTGQKVKSKLVEIPTTDKQKQDIFSHIDKRIPGGTAEGCNVDFKAAYSLSYDIVDDYMANYVHKMVYKTLSACPQNPVAQHMWAVAKTQENKDVAEACDTLLNELPQRVMLVVHSSKHAKTMIDRLLALGVPNNDIWSIGGNATTNSKKVAHHNTVDLSEKDALAMLNKGERVPKICVVGLEYCEGFNLNWMTMMVTGVYPSNQAKRTQMKGRINRVGDYNITRWHRHYIKFHTGMTTVALKHHLKAEVTQKMLDKVAHTFTATRGRK